MSRFSTSVPGAVGKMSSQRVLRKQRQIRIRQRINTARVRDPTLSAATIKRWTR